MFEGRGGAGEGQEEESLPGESDSLAKILVREQCGHRGCRALCRLRKKKISFLLPGGERVGAYGANDRIS